MESKGAFANHRYYGVELPLYIILVYYIGIMASNNVLMHFVENTIYLGNINKKKMSCNQKKNALLSCYQAVSMAESVISPGIRLYLKSMYA